MGQSKLLASIVAGATVGAALSMLDRATREKQLPQQKMKEAISYYHDKSRRIAGFGRGKSTRGKGAL